MPGKMGGLLYSLVICMLVIVTQSIVMGAWSMALLLKYIHPENAPGSI